MLNAEKTRGRLGGLLSGGLLALGLAASAQAGAADRLMVERDPAKPLYVVAMIDGKKKVVVIPAGTNRASQAIDFDKWSRGEGVDEAIDKATREARVASPSLPASPVDMGQLGKPRMEPFAKLVDALAKQSQVDPALVRAVIHAESAFNPKAISPKGAGGLMQLMPATAERFGVSDRFSPEENIRGGVAYLKFLLDEFDDPKLAVAAYNAGEGAVAKYKGIPPYKETQTYVGRVMSLWSAYRNQYGKS